MSRLTLCFSMYSDMSMRVWRDGEGYEGVEGMWVEYVGEAGFRGEAGGLQARWIPLPPARTSRGHQEAPPRCLLTGSPSQPFMQPPR